MRSRRRLLCALAAGLAAVALELTPAAAQLQTEFPEGPPPGPPVCPAIPDPAAVPPSAAPADRWADPLLFATPAISNDFHWTHAAMHLQGAPALVKWGACMFFNPDRDQTGAADLTGWRSALVVNNPSPTVTANVTIIYRDPQGVPLGPPITVALGPERTFVRGAVELRTLGPGIGSVEVAADSPIVGATLHHFGRLTLANGITVTDPDLPAPPPGADSMQQLQMLQATSTLYAGPFPISNTAPEDFLNGILPLSCVLNPNPTPTTLTVTSVAAPAGPTSTRSFTLPAFGMHLDTTLWRLAEQRYESVPPPGPFDADVITTVTSDGNPILGDYFMVDVLGNRTPTDSSNLIPGGSFRMGSGMMQGFPARRLINPEHTETSVPGPLPATPPVETMMSIANVSATDIGPVTVEIFARTGGPPIAVLTLPTLPPASVQRITPPAAPVPIPQNFAGWARITACLPGLIGWSMREVQQQMTPPTLHYHKVFGEELDGAGGAEPGAGFPVMVGGLPWIRKVAPLLRAAADVDPPEIPDWWPSHVNAVNHASPNIGPYRHRFYTLGGAVAGSMLFAGLSFANTSFTYVDPIVTLLPVDANVSGRFDRTGGTAAGIEAIGDPLVEWEIPMFLGPDVDEALRNLPHP